MAYTIQKDQFLMAVVFIFIGILIAVYFMGAHRSPAARARNPPASRTPRREPYGSEEVYPSDERPY